MLRTFIRLFLFPLLFFSCRQSVQVPSSKPSGGTTQVETYIVSSSPLDNTVTTHGNILPNEEVELRSEISGQIVDIKFKEGGSVSKGQLLIQVDDSELQPGLDKLRIELKIAKDELERKSQLFEIQGISKEEFEDAQLKVSSIESDINLTQAKIRKSKIIAPFSGTIGLRYVSPGAYVSPGSSIAKLVQTDPVKIEFTVPEIYASQIKPGSVLVFTLAGGDKKFQAAVYAFDPMIEPASRSLKVRAKADNKKGELIPGSFVDLKITLQQIQNAILIPSLSVITDIKGQKVFVIRNGKATSIFVKTGLQQDDLIQITEGIQPGDSVITTALLSLKDEMPVMGKVVSIKK